MGQQRPAGVGILHKLSLVSIFPGLQAAGHLEQIPLKLACKLIIGASYEEKWNAGKLDFIHFTSSYNSSVGGALPPEVLRDIISIFWSSLWATLEKDEIPRCVVYVRRFLMGRGNTKRSLIIFGNTK